MGRAPQIDLYLALFRLIELKSIGAHAKWDTLRIHFKSSFRPLIHILSNRLPDQQTSPVIDLKRD